MTVYISGIQSLVSPPHTILPTLPTLNYTFYYQHAFSPSSTYLDPYRPSVRSLQRIILPQRIPSFPRNAPEDADDDGDDDKDDDDDDDDADDDVTRRKGN